ncbi:MAG: hypothetical protein GY927_10910 [bacterium]|nr:hypothetical protein [bacterium]
MTNTNALLQKLQDREAKLKAQIKKAKATAAKEAAALDTERHRIIGAAILAEIDENEPLRALVQPVIETRTTNPRARKILGLDPLPKTGKKGEEERKNNPADAG